MLRQGEVSNGLNAQESSRREIFPPIGKTSLLLCSGIEVGGLQSPSHRSHGAAALDPTGPMALPPLLVAEDLGHPLTELVAFQSGRIVLPRSSRTRSLMA